jgi:L-alanine-DL-glutamate epimerase-like enolase superfamily enzyme
MMKEGLGEVAIIPHYGAETQRGACQVIDDVLAPNLLGKDPKSIEALTAQMDQLIKRNAYAKGAVEMACVDLVAKAAGLSADALFGGRVRKQIPILWVLATGDADKDIAEAERKLEQGLHKLFLVKIGHGDPLTDVARAVAVKRALGYHASIRVDINQGWDEATATRAIAELEAGGIDVAEQSLPAANIEGMRRLTERFAIPIMADEPIETVEDAFAFARANAADAFSLKLCKHGGLNDTRKVAAVAGAAGLFLRQHWCPEEGYFQASASIRSASSRTAFSKASPSSPAILPAVALSAAIRSLRRFGFNPLMKWATSTSLDAGRVSKFLMMDSMTVTFSALQLNYSQFDCGPVLNPAFFSFLCLL